MTGMGRCNGAESLNLRGIAVIASGRDNKHVSLRELNPVKVRVEATIRLKLLALIDHARSGEP
jgi:hypothetical protein